MGSERRGRAVHGRLEVNPSGEEPTDRPRQKNAGLWEPYDGRLSRTVLREREGEVPSRHSPGTDFARSWNVFGSGARKPRSEAVRLRLDGLRSLPGELAVRGGVRSRVEQTQIVGRVVASSHPFDEPPPEKSPLPAGRLLLPTERRVDEGQPQVRSAQVARDDRSGRLLRCGLLVASMVGNTRSVASRQEGASEA